MRPDPIQGVPEGAGQKILRRVGSRTKRGPMASTRLPSGGYRFPDAVSEQFNAGAPVPYDWVPGTDIVMNIILYSPTTGTAVMTSSITITKDGDAYSTGNYESGAAFNQSFTANVAKKLSRTISGAALESEDTFNWTIVRNGAAAEDTINNIVDGIYISGFWFEYTAWLA